MRLPIVSNGRSGPDEHRSWAVLREDRRKKCKRKSAEQRGPERPAESEDYLCEETAVAASRDYPAGNSGAGVQNGGEQWQDGWMSRGDLWGDKGVQRVSSNHDTYANGQCAETGAAGQAT